MNGNAYSMIYSQNNFFTEKINILSNNKRNTWTFRGMIEEKLVVNPVFIRIGGEHQITNNNPFILGENILFNVTLIFLLLYLK